MHAKPRRFAIGLVFTFALLAPLAASAQDGKRPITAQDLWAVKRVGAPALSPDGKRAVVSVQEWSIEKNTPSAALWLVDVASGDTRRLTAGTGSDGAPAWSPDGRRIAFVGKRGEHGGVKFQHQGQIGRRAAGAGNLADGGHIGRDQ